MLSLANSLSSISSALLDIVKSGLQAWYKADNTQAPLGEEEIANGSFATGPELVIDGDFSPTSPNAPSFNAWTKDDNWTISGGYATSDGSAAGNLDQTILTSGKGYKVTLEVSNMTQGALSVRLGGTNQIANISENGTYTFYGTADATVFRLRAQDVGGVFDGSVDNVSVKQTNPNDSWNTVEAGWEIQDGKAVHTWSGSPTNLQPDNALISDRKYQATLTVSDMTAGALSVRFGSASGTEVLSITSNGTYTVTDISGGTVFRLRAQEVASAGFDGSVSNVSLREVVNSVKDFSPNNNNGVLYSGKALRFDGSADTIDFGNPGYSMKTVAFWINVADVTSNTEQLMEFQTSNGISSVDGTITTAGTWTGKVTYVDGVAGTSLTAGNWHRVVLTTTAAITVNDFVVGYDDSNYGDFDIADLQIYDKAWTTSDITYDYNNPDKDVFDNSNSSIVTTDCKALYRLNEGAGDRVYNAAPVLGEELVVDGSWALHSPEPGDWSIDNVNNIFTSSGGTGSIRNTDGSSSVSVGKYYKATFEILEITAGGVKLFSGDGQDQASHKSTVGVHTYVFESLSNSIYLHSNGFNGSVGNVSFKEITLPESYVQNSWVSGNWVTAQPYIPQYAMSSYSKKIVFGGVGSGDQVDLGSEVTLAADKAASISFWFTYGTTDTSTDKYIFGKISSATDYLIINPQSGGVDKIQIRMNNVSSQLDIDTDLTLGKMYHCVLTMPAYSSGSEAMKCYINGVLQSDTENRTNNSWDFQRIGGHSGTSNNFDGILDEIAYFSKELSEAEVQEIFNAGMALDCRDHSAYLSDVELLPAISDFTIDSNDTDEISIVNGNAVFNSSSVGDEYLYKSSLSGINTNGFTEVSVTVENYVRGSLRVYFGDPNTDVVIAEGNGTFKAVIQSDQNIFYIQALSGGFEGTVTAVSAKNVDLKGYWRNNGSDTWTDLSPYGNNGTVNGSPTTIQLQEVPYFKKDTFGLPMNRVRQKGLNLDGDSYIKVDDDSSLGAMDDGFTCAFWYRNSQDTTDPDFFYMVSKGTGLSANVNNGFGVSNYNNKIYADLNTADGRFTINYSIGAASSSSPVWYYITATYNGSDELELYVDATSRGTDAVTGSVSATAEAYPITIGTNFGYNAKMVKGVIDEVKWYNRALSLSEIEKNYKATKSKHSSTSSWSDDFDGGFI